MNVLTNSFLILCCLNVISIKSSEVSEGNNQFAKDFYHVLARYNGNVFFSPVSVHCLLTLLYQAARGETAKQFQRTLKVSQQRSSANGYKIIMNGISKISAVKLRIANKVYVEHDLKLARDFQDIARDSFLAEVESMDFSRSEAAAQTINNWVQNKTEDKIKNLVSPNSLGASTVAVLVNAIYFKGDWLYTFDQNNTRNRPFYVSEKSSVNCQMMHQTIQVGYRENNELNAQMIILPYKNENLYMTIILPRNKNGIHELERKLANYNFENFVNDEFTFSEATIEIFLPRFKIESKIDLHPILKELGLGDLFSNPNLSGMLESQQSVAVSKALQQSYIAVNEEGSEAAAASLAVVDRIIGGNNITFVADHPFLFGIFHSSRNNNNLLFFGRLSQP